METALVRVSRVSQVVLNRVQAIRAITLTDVSAILSSQAIDFVIFEGVKPEEVEAIKELRKDYRMPMYTFGDIQIEGIRNCVGLSDLQDRIEGDTGILVRTYAVQRSPILWDHVFDEFGNEVIESLPETEHEEEFPMLEQYGQAESEPDASELEIPQFTNAEPSAETSEEPSEEQFEPQGDVSEIYESKTDASEGLEITQFTDEQPTDEQIAHESEQFESEIQIEQPQSGAEFISEESQPAVEPSDGSEESISEVIDSVVDTAKTLVETIVSAVVPEDSVDEQPAEEAIQPSEAVEESSETAEQPSEAVEESSETAEEAPTEATEQPSEVVAEQQSEEAVYAETAEQTTEIAEQTAEVSETSSETSETSSETAAVATETAEQTKKTENKTQELITGLFSYTADLPNKDEFIGQLKELTQQDELKVDDNSALFLSLATEVAYYRKVIHDLQASPIALESADLLAKVEEIEKSALTSVNSEEVNALKAELEALNKDLEGRTKELSKLSDSLKVSEAKSAELAQKLDSLKSKVTNLEATKATLEQQLQSQSTSSQTLATEKASLETQIKSLTEELTSVRSQFESLTASSSDKDSHVAKLVSTITDREQQAIELREVIRRTALLVDSYKNKYNTEAQRSKMAVEQCRTLIREKGELSQQNSKLQSDIDERDLRISRQKKNYEAQLADADRRRTELSTQIQKLELNTTELELKVDTLQQERDQAILERDGANKVKEELEQETAETSKSLATANETIKELHEQLEQMKLATQEARLTKEDLTISDATVTELQKEIGKLQIRLNETERLCGQKDKRIGELNTQVANAEKAVKVAERARSVGGTVNLMCRYSARAYLLPVFGGGSYGITTTAVSMAKKIFKENGGNILLLDFDLVSPKINSFFSGAKPMLSYREDGLDPLYSTGVGLLMMKGSTWFLDHREELIQTVEQVKKSNKRIDYFSGLQTTIDSSRFIAIDWTELMNTLGNDYDYIILDLGKIGANTTQDALIRMFNSISLRTTVVSLKDDDAVRNLYVKVKNINKLDTRKLVWLLNMGANTGVTNLMSKLFTNMPYRIMTFNSGFYNEHKVFGNALIKGMFDELVDDLILKGNR
mgnify:FL=1